MTEKASSIHFPQGVPGFQELRDFVISAQGEDSPFYVMQSVEDEKVGFVLVNPFEVYRNYEIRLPESAIELLGVEKPEDVTVYAFVTLRQPVEESTVNLLAPVVVHSGKSLGIQAVLMDERLSIREKLFAPAVKEGAK